MCNARFCVFTSPDSSSATSCKWKNLQVRHDILELIFIQNRPKMLHFHTRLIRFRIRRLRKWPHVENWLGFNQFWPISIQNRPKILHFPTILNRFRICRLKKWHHVGNWHFSEAFWPVWPASAPKKRQYFCCDACLLTEQRSLLVIIRLLIDPTPPLTSPLGLLRTIEPERSLTVRFSFVSCTAIANQKSHWLWFNPASCSGFAGIIVSFRILRLFLYWTFI